MDALQFSLFFAALLVGYILIHLRMVRFEEYLREIAGLRTLNDRVKAIAEQLDKLRTDRLENHLQRLHEDLEDLREATSEVGQAVVRIPTAPSPVVDTAESRSAALSPGERVRALVETRLLQLGYTNLRLLTDLSTVHGEGDVEVQVECERNQMPCKGRVVTRNGAVRDVSIQSVATLFP